MIEDRTFRACFFSRIQLDTLVYAKAELGVSYYDYLFKTFLRHNNEK